MQVGKNRQEARQYEDNDGPALLNEFLTPVNTFTESQLQQIFRIV
jgi:hypothetical protein